MTRCVSVLVAVFGLVPAWIILPTASAQESPLTADVPEAPPRIEVDLDTGVWIARLDGNVALGANSGRSNLRLKEDFDLNDSEIEFNAELTVRFDDRWYLRATGFEFSTDTQNTFVGNASFGSLALNDGDSFSASADILSVSIEGGLDLFRPLPDWRRPELSRTSLRVSGIAGARYLGVDQEVQTAAGIETGSGNWLALYAGVDVELRFAADALRPRGRGLVLDVGTGAGAEVVEGGLLAYVRAALTLEVTDNFGVFFGYRLLEVDFEDAPYGFDAGLQGLFVGGSVRF